VTRIQPLRTSALVAAILVPMALAPMAVPADKTDVIRLGNGDQVTGEVKRLSLGQLEYSTDDMGTLYIEWNKIAFLKTEQLLQLQLLDGARYTGHVVEAQVPVEGVLLLKEEDAMPAQRLIEVRLADIARIDPLDTGSWRQRLDGSVSLGYSFAQSTGVEVMNFRGTLRSRGLVRAWSVDLNSQITDDEDSPSSKRGSLVGRIEHPLHDRYFLGSNLEFSRNEELGLDLRTLLGVSFGRYLVQTADRQWQAGAGLAGSREDYGPDDERSNIEMQLASVLRLYRFDTPKRDIDLDIVILPSLSDWGRVRIETSLNVDYEIVKDFFFGISFYESHDNRPAEGAANNDWGVTTSVGYKF
jgi:hypothetical protein